MEISADQDPVGQQYKYTINFIGPADLYEEYIADFEANRGDHPFWQGLLQTLGILQEGREDQSPAKGQYDHKAF
jgi:hypothetical protein